MDRGRTELIAVGEANCGFTGDRSDQMFFTSNRLFRRSEVVEIVARNADGDPIISTTTNDQIPVMKTATNVARKRRQLGQSCRGIFDAEATLSRFEAALGWCGRLPTAAADGTVGCFRGLPKSGFPFADSTPRVPIDMLRMEKLERSLDSLMLLVGKASDSNRTLQLDRLGERFWQVSKGAEAIEASLTWLTALNEACGCSERLIPLEPAQSASTTIDAREAFTQLKALEKAIQAAETAFDAETIAHEKLISELEAALASTS